MPNTCKSCIIVFCTLTFMPTFVLCMSTRARRSLLERLPRKSLTNLLAYLRLSPQPPHCQALRFSRSGASSHVQRSMRPALQALAIACVRPAEEMAYKKAVSLNPEKAQWRQTRNKYGMHVRFVWVQRERSRNNLCTHTSFYYVGSVAPLQGAIPPLKSELMLAF